jgi:RimJ/RimL family protein N-acetyltransferase
MAIAPITLTGRTLRLVPLTPAHAADLLAAADADLFTYQTMRIPSDEWHEAGFAAYIERILARERSHPFAIVPLDSGRAVGITCYLDIRAVHRGLEVGLTWIGRAHQGTVVNPESKYLLLRHAFEDMNMLRVQFKTDRRNVHSQRAIVRLGAVQEGILRKHMVLVDGSVRDSIYYSIIDVEWPTIKTRLETRLGYVP